MTVSLSSTGVFAAYHNKTTFLQFSLQRCLQVTDWAITTAGIVDY